MDFIAWWDIQTGPKRYVLIDMDLCEAFWVRELTQEKADEKNAVLDDCKFSSHWWEWPEKMDA